MNPVVLVVLLLLAAAVLARLTRPRGPARRRFPKPGEGMRRRDVTRSPVSPAGMVAVRRGVPAEEAHVLVGLLESSGIIASATAARGGFTPRGAPRSIDVYVAAAQADDARALLREVG